MEHTIDCSGKPLALLKAEISLIPLGTTTLHIKNWRTSSFETIALFFKAISRSIKHIDLGYIPIRDEKDLTHLEKYLTFLTHFKKISISVNTFNLNPAQRIKCLAIIRQAPSNISLVLLEPIYQAVEPLDAQDSPAVAVSQPPDVDTPAQPPQLPLVDSRHSHHHGAGSHHHHGTRSHHHHGTRSHHHHGTRSHHHHGMGLHQLRIDIPPPSTDVVIRFPTDNLPLPNMGSHYDHGTGPHQLRIDVSPPSTDLVLRFATNDLPQPSMSSQVPRPLPQLNTRNPLHNMRQNIRQIMQLTTFPEKVAAIVVSYGFFSRPPREIEHIEQTITPTI